MGDDYYYLLNTCCPDWEDGFSMNPCCPVSVSACVSINETGALCGEAEPDDEINKRPTYYKDVEVVNGGYYIGGKGPIFKYRISDETGLCEREDIPREDYCDDLYQNEGKFYKIGGTEVRTTQGPTSREQSPCGTSPDPYIPDSGSHQSDWTETNKRLKLPEKYLSGNCVTEAIPKTGSGSSSWTFKVDFCSSQGPNYYEATCNSSYGNDGWEGKTTFRDVIGDYVRSGSNNIYGECTSQYGERVTTSTLVYEDEVEKIESDVIYTNSDSESSALSRGEDVQGKSCVTSDYRFSTRPNRANKKGVSKTTVKHEAVVTRLVVGFCYEGVIPIERAYISYDEWGYRIPPQPEDWLPFSLTAIDAFRAEQVFQTFGLGTLNVSDDDFINASFSLDPYDYPSYFPVDPETGILIDPDALVLTPFSDLPESKVYDYRVRPAIMRRLECEEI